MVLMVAMAVPGNGPEKVSGEVDAPRLDMNGRWEGTFLNVGGIMWKTVIEDGKERDYDRGRIIAANDWKVVDEGEGKLRLYLCPSKPSRGIYKVEGDQVTICFSDMPNPRPTEFRVDKLQAMYILHRVKSRK
jgi:hypothetical protein